MIPAQWENWRYRENRDLRWGLFSQAQGWYRGHSGQNWGLYQNLLSPARGLQWCSTSSWLQQGCCHHATSCWLHREHPDACVGFMSHSAWLSCVHLVASQIGLVLLPASQRTFPCFVLLLHHKKRVDVRHLCSASNRQFLLQWWGWRRRRTGTWGKVKEEEEEEQ